ncbi:MAG: hypothetical protein RL094_278 [Candidatus Parcubacteria bacterium]|jgi:hypothetical protein
MTSQASEQEIQQEIKVGGIYQSSKNKNLYKVLALAKHSETLEDLVIYEAQYENTLSKVWARPRSMFLEIVERDGVKQPRFILVE